MNIAYNGFLKVLIKKLLLKNGTSVNREVVSTSHSVGMFCHNAANTKFFFTKQYRIGPEKEIIEIPAGRIDKGEQPKDAAIREVREELGMEVIKIDFIKAIYASPGYTNEVLFIYDVIVKDEFLGQELDGDEELEIITMDEDEVEEFLESNTLIDAKTLVALQHIFGR